jgi:hypothetical protein
LTLPKRVVFGAIGAALPVLANAYAVDLETTFTQLTLPLALGYSVKAVILLLFGCITMTMATAISRRIIFAPRSRRSTASFPCPRQPQR